MHIVILGLPAAGKSTLTMRLCEVFPSAVSFGVRRYFARQVALKTALGENARPYVEAARWLPDHLVGEAISQEVDAGRSGQLTFFEGVPASLSQAKMLDAILGARGLSLDLAVHVVTPPSVCITRASARLVCHACDGGAHPAKTDTSGRCVRCGEFASPRSSDAIEPFLQRLSTQQQLLGPLLDYYSPTRLLEVDGEEPAQNAVEAMLRQSALAGFRE